MRALSTDEIEQCTGGMIFGFVQIAGAYYVGRSVGEGLNQAFTGATGVSLGEYIYTKNH